MSAAPHRIRRQRWTVKTGSPGEAFALRQHLRTHWREDLLPALERALDEAAGHDRTLHLSKLELSFRFLSPVQVTAELPELLYQQARDQLATLVQRQAADEPPPPPTDPGVDPLHNLLHYLRTGCLPWPARRESSADANAALLETCQRERVRLLEYLRTQDETADFQFRLLQLQPASEALAFASAAVNRLAVELQAGVSLALPILLASAPALLGRYSQLRLLAAMLGSVDAASPMERATSLANIAASVLTAAEQPAFEQILRSLPASAARWFRPTADGAAAGATRAVHAGVAAPKQIAQPNSCWPSSGESAGSGQPRDQVPVEPALQAASRSREDGSDFATPAHYAGLVLLHPFLPRFFEAIQLDPVGGGIAADTSSERLNSLPPRPAARAAAALHFLATGEAELFEHELAFIKVLLGRHPDHPLLVAEGLLDANTKAESEALLRSVITHWAALKNSSLAALRESFLNRPALLRETASGWKVQFERRPYDVLLDRLPWTIGVVKLPWMPLPLFTEW